MISNGTATNVYCPGCAPGDFPQPHICGISTDHNITGGYCAICGQSWTGMHYCPKLNTTRAAETMPTPFITTTTASTSAASCDHCWCLKQKAGWHEVPDPARIAAGWIGPATVRQHLKPHQVCCNCGNRRLKG